MLKHKSIRSRGKIPLSRFFTSFNKGDSVALVKELSVNSNVPDRMQGRTGKVLGKRGSSYVVEVNDLNMAKKFIVHPIHLKRIKNT